MQPAFLKDSSFRYVKMIKCSKPGRAASATLKPVAYTLSSAPTLRLKPTLDASVPNTKAGLASRYYRHEPVFRLKSASLLPQCRQASSSAFNSHGGLNRTALHELHMREGGKIVPFGGYAMPVQYSDLGVGESHKWTREKASLFDVGHMVQHRLSGPGAAHLIEKITPSSTASLQIGNSTLSCLLHPATGGIVDDTVITRLGPELFYLVTNAACKAKDIAYLEGQIGSRDTSHGTLDWEVLSHWGLVALQGPLSADILQRALVTAGVENVDLKALYFGQCKHVTLKLPSKQSSLDPATPILISRGGYTGEDGFEISIPPALTVVFTTHLLDVGGRERLRLAGLGARDSLRLEAGMCLYGHDLDDTITPVEAGLGWIVHKDRRDSGGFHGDLTILRQLRPVRDGGLAPKHRRIGLIVEGAPAREGAVIIDPASPDAEVVGRVTSGCPSPTLGKNIAMGYVRPPLHKAGTPIEVLVRGKRRKAEVVKMPFVRSNYWKQAAGTSPG